jgi:cyanate permease
MGIVLSASAFGGFVAAPLYTLIMRETGTWKAGWLAAGALCALALVASLFVRNKPSDTDQFPDGINPDSTSDTAGSPATKKAKTYRTSETWVLKDVLRQPVLYFIGICMISQMSVLYLLTTHGVLHFTDAGFTRMQAASAMGNFVLFSGFARLPMGIIGDNIEPRWIMALALCGMGVATLGIWNTPKEFGVLLAIMSVFGFCFGSMVPLFPAIIGNYFGPSVFAPIVGFLSPVMILLGAPVPLVAGIIYDKFQSYDIAFVYVTALTFVAMLLALALIPPNKTQPPSGVPPGPGIEGV